MTMNELPYWAIPDLKLFPIDTLPHAKMALVRIRQMTYARANDKDIAARLDRLWGSNGVPTDEQLQQGEQRALDAIARFTEQETHDE